MGGGGISLFGVCILVSEVQYTVFSARPDTHDLGHPDFPQASKTKLYLFLLGPGTVKGGTPSKELFLVDSGVLGKLAFFPKKEK